MKKHIFNLLIVSVLIFAGILFSCKKDKNNNNSTVPNQDVDIYIYPGDPQFNTTIGVPGGWVYITGGNKGIIVYRISNSDFVAYDRTCPYDPNTAAKMKVETADMTVRDTVCGSKFQILDGSVVQGPAAQAMKAYGTTYDGQVLHIYN